MIIDKKRLLELQKSLPKSDQNKKSECFQSLLGWVKDFSILSKRHFIRHKSLITEHYAKSVYYKIM